MDKQEAILQLQACRPNGEDAMNPAVIEALAFVNADPELKAWWEAQQAFDRAVASKLVEIPVPEHLRDTILAGRPQAAPRPAQPKLLGWLAIAAIVAILCVAGTFVHVAKYGPLDNEDYAQAVISDLRDDSPPLEMLSPDHAKIVAWLQQQKAPVAAFPGQMSVLPSVGCQKFQVHGHTVSLICFEMTGGKIAHLFVADENVLRDPPGTGTPEFRDADGWRTAAWSDGRMTYFVATQADMSALKQLL